MLEGQSTTTVNSKNLVEPLKIEITCVTKAKEMHMWYWKKEHNYLENK
jgi:hypothetical protein